MILIYCEYSRSAGLKGKSSENVVKHLSSIIFISRWFIGRSAGLEPDAWEFDSLTTDQIQSFASEAHPLNQAGLSPEARKIQSFNGPGCTGRARDGGGQFESGPVHQIKCACDGIGIRTSLRS